MLNLSFVRSFVAVADTGSFQKAAQELNLSQPTLSQHVSKLEDRLGVRLFERGRVRSPTTPEGANVLPLARAMLRIADRLAESAKRPELRIGASGNIADYFLPSALASFQNEAPVAVPWRLVQAQNPTLPDMLANGDVDVAVTEWEPRGPDITARFWRKEQLLLIVAPDHPLASEKAVDVGMVEHLAMIGGGAGTGTGTLLREILGKDADKLQTRFSLGSTEAVKNAVGSGLGYSIVLKGCIEAELASGRLVGLPVAGVELAKTFFVSHRSTETEASPVFAFVRHLTAQT